MTHVSITLVALLALAVADAAVALSIGQTDDFQSGTTENWISGVPNPLPPTTVPGGGPAGAADTYLLMRSSGEAGPGSRLVAFNPAQWAGDYTSAGIASITMDVFNLGGSDLSLRLMFMDPPTNVAVSTDAVFVPAGGGWTPVTFPVLASDLTAQFGDVNAVLSNTTVLRLFHGIDTGFPPQRVIAALGVDNICALGADGDASVCGTDGTPVPEPGTLVLLGVGMIGLMVGRRRSAAAPVRTAVSPPA